MTASRLSRLAVVLAATALSVTGQRAASDTLRVADLTGTLSGPSTGQVGDVLTYTVTATNKGPDFGDATVSFVMETNSGLEFVGSTPTCSTAASSADQVAVSCTVERLPAGGTFQLSVQVRVKTVVQTTLDALVSPANTTDPDTTNNAVTIVVLAAPSPPPPPPPPPPGAGGVAGLKFVDTLPHAVQGSPYLVSTIAVAATQQSPPARIRLSAGRLPRGLSVSTDGILEGVPAFADTFEFTLEASDGIAGDATVEHAYSLVVDPRTVTNTWVPPQAAADRPPKALVGHTVLLAARKKTSACHRGDLPDLRCSPGAYYSKLTKKAICAKSFRTAAVHYVPQSMKYAVETEYGMVAKSYGRTMEIDQIISLELGGSNDIANLFPEAGSGSANYHAKDQLENKLHALVCAGTMTLAAARTGIASNWKTLYNQVYGVAAP